MSHRYNRLPVAILAALLLWAATAQVFISRQIIGSMITGDNRAAMPFALESGSLAVSGIAGNAKTAGLRHGDEVVMLNGQRITGYRQLDLLRPQLKPGEMLQASVKRMENGRAVTMTVAIPLEKPSRRAVGWVFSILLYTVLPVISLALGFFIAFSRPHDKLAWITFAMLASFGQLVSEGSFYALSAPWQQIVEYYRSLLNSTWPLWLTLFGLYFPTPFAFLERRRWIAWLLAAPFALLIGSDFYLDTYEGTNLAHVGWLMRIEHSLTLPMTVFIMFYVTAFFVSLTIKHGQTRNPDARRRFQWILAGSGLALTPVLALVICSVFLNIRLPIWYVVSSLSAVVLFPLTLAYVIVVQRAMDVRVAVRLGVQYAFARGGLGVVRVLLSILVIAALVRVAMNAGNVYVSVGVAVVGTATLLLLRRLGRRATQWMDRKYFREAYDTEVILSELGESVASIRDSATLLETVTQRISASLHVARVVVLLDAAGAFRPAYALGYAGTPSVSFKPDATAIEVMRSGRKPSRVYLDDEKSWVQHAGAEEREILRILDTQLLLPVALKERLLGVISLGPKQSEEPYSPTDLRLLHAVASQTGLALENARLTESIRDEVAQRERINRELEIAREVQQRLFPQELPRVPGIDLAGLCRPQQGVGGDYYDFILVNGGCLGIAVGDVAGKGIAAALMMASLQASLRGQTIRPTGSLAEMVQMINRLLYEASASNRYATFFYCQLDPRTRMLRYVNAGHNPPILWRAGAGAGAGEIIRLEEGGTVVGSFPKSAYVEASLQLNRGDVLLAFTDGISEAMNDAGDEWDEERLLTSLRECSSMTAAETIAHLLESVDAFTGGAKQYDDMTLVAVRVE